MFPLGHIYTLQYIHSNEILQVQSASCLLKRWNVSIFLSEGCVLGRTKTGFNPKHKFRKQNFSTAEELQQAGCCSQLGQFVHRRVKLEVWREKLGSSWVDESVRLPDRHVCHACDVSDFCGRAGK